MEETKYVVYIPLAPVIKERQRLCCVFFFVDMSDGQSCSMFQLLILPLLVIVTHFRGLFRELYTYLPLYIR